MTDHRFDNLPASRRVVAFFDLDKTIIAKSSALAFGRPFFDAGLISRATVARMTYNQVMYLFSGPNDERLNALRQEMAEMVAGWDAAEVKEIVTTAMIDVVEPYIYQEALDLIREHQRQGHAVVIVSTSGREMVEPVADLIGATECAATQMEVVDGRYTGKVTFYCQGRNKVVAMRQIAERLDADLADCYAYSDSHTDQPMLEAVGHAVVVNADKPLTKLAEERGWESLRFVISTPLAPQRSVNTTYVAGVIAVVGALVAAGTVAWRYGALPEWLPQPPRREAA